MTKKLNIYWTHEDVEYTGFAEYIKDDVVCGVTYEDRIRFVDERGVTCDYVEQADCDPGITLDMIWEDLESAVDDDGRLDITDIRLA